MMNFDLAGAQQQMTIQYGGTQVVEGVTEHIYRTDFDDELEEWTGESAPELLSEGEVAPSSDELCQTNLNAERALGFTANE